LTIQIVNFALPNVLDYYLNKYQTTKPPADIPDYAVEFRNLNHDNYLPLYEFISLNKTDCFYRSDGNPDCLLLPGTPESFTKFSGSISGIFPELHKKLSKVLSSFFHIHQNFSLISNSPGAQFPYVMGILNVTPDSFSDGGKYLNANSAISHALEMIEQGADIIDIGGESTRPGSHFISPDEELNRVIPVIDGILKNNPAAVLSVDTTKATVARAALDRGVRIINDISGLTFAPDILEPVIEYNATLVIMHISGTPKNMQVNPHYDNVVNEVYDFLSRQTETAEKAGVHDIIIDPGIGFGKKAGDNYEIIQRQNELNALGYPLLIGLSRKSFIGKSLNLDIDSRDTATATLETLCMKQGATIVRTHNVKNAVHSRNILKFLNNPESLNTNV